MSPENLKRILLWLSFGVFLVTPFVFIPQLTTPAVTGPAFFCMTMIEMMVVFYVWLMLKDNRYVPRVTPLFVGVGVYVIVLILTALTGVDVGMSMWSSFQRMTGIVFMIHLGIFFTILSSVVERRQEWMLVFSGVVVATGVATLLMYLGIGGLNAPFLRIFQNGGAVFDNTSTAGTYVLFGLFISLLVFYRYSSRAKVFLGLLVIGILANPLYLDTAYLFGGGGSEGDPFWLGGVLGYSRAAAASIWVGLALVAAGFLSIRTSSRALRVSLRASMLATVLGLCVGSALLLVPGSRIQNAFIEHSSHTRPIAWEIAAKSFLQRPIVGWGSENFHTAVLANFRPELFIDAFGDEQNFDRVHNIILDTAVSGGIIGLFSFFSLIGIAWYQLWKQSRLSPKFAGDSVIIAVLLFIYLLQNMTWFDTVHAYLFLFGVLAFVNSRSIHHGSWDVPNVVGDDDSQAVRHSRSAPIMIVVGAVMLGVWIYVVGRPLQANRAIIEVLTTQHTLAERRQLYQKIITTPYDPGGALGILSGSYQSRIVESAQSRTLSSETAAVVQDDLKNLMQTFDAIAVLPKTSTAYKTALDKIALIHTYMWLSRSSDAAMVSWVRETIEELLDFSPKNLDLYRALAITEAYAGNLKQARSLTEHVRLIEPRAESFYQGLVQDISTIERARRRY